MMEKIFGGYNWKIIKGQTLVNLIALLLMVNGGMLTYGVFYSKFVVIVGNLLALYRWYEGNFVLVGDEYED